MRQSEEAALVLPFKHSRMNRNVIYYRVCSFENTMCLLQHLLVGIWDILTYVHYATVKLEWLD